SREKAVRERASARIKKVAPQRAEAGKTRRWSDPKSRGTIWGTANPTKPTRPDTETTDPTMREAAKKIRRRTFSTSTPKERALSSPKGIRFRAEASRQRMKKPVRTKRATQKSRCISTASRETTMRNQMRCRSSMETMELKNRIREKVVVLKRTPTKRRVWGFRRPFTWARPYIQTQEPRD